MPRYTIETTYRVPHYRQRNHCATSVEEACRRAIEAKDWSGQVPDFETAGETYVTGIWKGTDAAYRGEELSIPSHFQETIQRQADQFGELVALLDEIAPPPPMTLSRQTFENWLPRARNAVAKAKAILEGRRDPDDPVS